MLLGRALALFLMWSLIPGMCVHAQEFPLVEDSLRIEFLTVSDGLPTNSVTAVLQDYLGFLWVGTPRGLARYDGHVFTVYLTVSDESTRTGSDHIIDLYEDSAGSLWIATGDGGLSRFDRAANRFVSYDLGFRSAATFTSTMVEARSTPGVLWIGSRSEGLVRLDPMSGSLTAYRHETGNRHTIRNDVVHTVYEDQAGHFWVGTATGLDRFDVQTGRFIPVYPDSTSLEEGPASTEKATSSIRSIYEDPGSPGTLWLDTPGGLLRFDSKSGTIEQFQHIPATKRRLFFAHESTDREGTGTFWLGADSDLFLFDGDTDRFIRMGIVQRINDLHVDRSGILWIAAGGGGLGKLDPKSGRFGRLRLDADLTREINTQNPINNPALFEDRTGHFWIGYGQGNLAGIDRQSGRITYYRHDPNDSSSFGYGMVTDIYEDRAGALWIAACWDGLDRLERDTGAFTHYRFDPNDAGSLSGYCPNALLEDRTDNLWVGTWGGGLSRFDRGAGRFTRYVHDPDDPHSLGGDEILSLLEDRNGKLWIGTSVGVSVFDPEQTDSRSAGGEGPDGSFINYPIPGDVMAMREDLQGRIWLGAHGAGLHMLDPVSETLRVFTTRDGLAHDLIWDVLMDDRGLLWISTSNGLSRFDPETLTFQNYDMSDGLAGHQFLERSGYKSESGRLYFNTAGGIVTFDPQHISDDPMPPQVAITDFRLLGQEVSTAEVSPFEMNVATAEKIPLTYVQRDFTLTFAALTFRQSEKHRYMYRLEGYDDAWRSAGTRRTATYTNLAPGAYTFRVRAANRDGVWNEEGASIRITIDPPWWRTVWAYAFCVAAALGILMGSYRWRTRRLERHALELRQTVRERTRELVTEKTKTEEQAQKLLELGRAKDRFFANISHEFRTPLTLILGPLEDVLDGSHGPVDERVQRQLQIIRRNGRRLHHLITELLDLTRMDVGRLPLHLSRSDLPALLRSIVQSFAPLAERGGVSLQFRSEVDELSFDFDVDKLEKVVTNLLSNALKFTPEGGKVRVGLRTYADDEGECAELTVRDTGRGIPAEALPHIFDRFYQVDNSTTRVHEGTGIGLALAKSLVTLHGGSIKVESDEGFGSTFTVRLPMNGRNGQPCDTSENEKPAQFDERQTASTEWRLADRIDVPELDTITTNGSIPTRNHRPSTILLVEDNAEVRDYLREHLDEGYTIVEAENGRQGLERIHEVVPDLIITDVMMPVMDGVALCRAIKEDERLNHIPVILLTAKASEEAEVEGLEAGADDYITKPFHADALLARVENLIEIRRQLRKRFSGEVMVLHASEVAVSSEEAVFLSRVKDVVEAHLGDSGFTVEWLADEVGLSPRQLRRRLRTLVNLSPTGFMRMIRLERAAQLLEQRAGTVAQIAYAVGFQDPGYFARLFRQTFGMQPSEYKTNRA